MRGYFKDNNMKYRGWWTLFIDTILYLIRRDKLWVGGINRVQRRGKLLIYLVLGRTLDMINILVIESDNVSTIKCDL